MLGALLFCLQLSGNLEGVIGPGVFTVDAPIKVLRDKTLTLPAGTIFKFRANTVLDIGGTLLVNGTSAQPVTFTSIHDDSVGGDTNANGSATVPTPGDWVSIFTSTAQAKDSILDWLEVRYAGGSGVAEAIQLGADLTMRRCTVRDCASAAIGPANNSARPTVQDCAFLDNGGPAVLTRPLASLQEFRRNSAAGNAGGNHYTSSGASTAEDVTLGPNNCMNGAIVIGDSVSSGLGFTLKLLPGTVIKVMDGERFTVRGTLDARGTGLLPVAFTSYADDSIAGDTNGDGPNSLPAPGDWQGLFFSYHSTDNQLERLLLRYAGDGGWGGITTEHSAGPAEITLSMRDCLVTDCAADAILADGPSRSLMIADCDLSNNGGYPIRCYLRNLPGFVGNTADGNLADCPLVRFDTDGEICEIGPQNGIRGVIGCSGGSSSGGSLSIAPGTIVKCQGPAVALGDAMDLDGDLSNPVVITSWLDDEHGGDTNNDGAATQPGPGNWAGIVLTGSTPGRLAGLRILYAGSAPAIRCFNPQLELLRCRVERASGVGFDLPAVLRATELVAFACAGNGFQLWQDTSRVSRSTAAECGGVGFSAGSLFAREVVGCVGWGNAGGNFAGLAAGALRFSCGDPTAAGTHGNIHADPHFFAAAAGDLRLLPTSPCLDSGDPSLLANAATDADGLPRVVDGNLDRAGGADMGAFEFSPISLEILGTPSAGGWVQANCEGSAGFAAFVILADTTAAVRWLPSGVGILRPGVLVAVVPLGPLPAAQTLTLPPILPNVLTIQAIVRGPSGAAAPSRLLSYEI